LNWSIEVFLSLQCDDPSCRFGLVSLHNHMTQIPWNISLFFLFICTHICVFMCVYLSVFPMAFISLENSNIFSEIFVSLIQHLNLKYLYQESILSDVLDNHVLLSISLMLYKYRIFILKENLNICFITYIRLSIVTHNRIIIYLHQILRPDCTCWRVR
jgi:hypothetical protein